FEVEAGERVALLGANGAGKTTLLRCLLGLVPFEGEVRVDGLDAVREGVDARRRIGYVPQRAPVSDLPVGEFVTLVAGLRGVPVAKVARRLGGLGLDLEREASKPLRALSGGMLQKALLALVLSNGARVLLLDEPTGNLDPAARAGFLSALEEVDPGTTVILASHRLSDVQAVARRILVLHEGGIAFDGSVADVQERAPGIWAAGARTEEELFDRMLERIVREESEGEGRGAQPGSGRTAVTETPTPVADADEPADRGAA
ncbi:MAG: ATP-binding cassette domain-containing protein, partial [Gemmatimonadetes bacterium]|nr:ABC transporter ATP-binding protein [Gemmatimonadota bacterium]NIR76922.1 ABC transporter ATP-binding protein [Gemmatimonadota bacterium]NIT85451.1 ABC transporter ATP-binding protein [Gemmatimonadota bacterium]NIU29266.1 ABC transporter ATP-binding protein [Gemmatimonadota bacterium]NIU34344.1 ATP-binding cassette domain-containing protein [Gemmatimonadota bacterium]